MDDTHLGRLRAFALVMGLLLITYVVAGISVDPHIAALGLSFRISRPSLLPVGLAIASLCSTLRFYYYGLMLGTSPHRKRRDLIDGLVVHTDEYYRPGEPIKPVASSGRQIWMYWGPRKFSIPVWQVDRELTEKRAAVFDNAFPKFLGARASAQLVVEWGQDDDGESYATYNLDVVVPRRCRAAAIFEDLDYTAPVWLNLLALLFLVWSLKWPKMISISS